MKQTSKHGKRLTFPFREWEQRGPAILLLSIVKTLEYLMNLTFEAVDLAEGTTTPSKTILRAETRVGLY